MRGLRRLVRRGAGAGVTPSVSISGAVTIGGTMTITATGVPSPRFTLLRDGVSAGTITSPYTYVAADIGPVLTVLANGVGSATSNALQYTFATDSNILDGLLGSSYVSGTNWPTIKAVGTATINSTAHVAASTLAGKASMNFDGNAAGYVTVTGLGGSLSTQSGCSVFTVMQTSQATVATVWEYVSTSNMAMDVHDTNTAEILPSGTYWTEWASPDPASAAASWSLHFNRALLSGVAGVRKGGVAVTTAQHGSAGTPGGNYGSGNLVIGSDNTHALRCGVNMSIFLMTTSALSPTGNAALTIEAAMSYFGGV